jgi:hypothetical protein
MNGRIDTSANVFRSAAGQSLRRLDSTVMGGQTLTTHYLRRTFISHFI